MALPALEICGPPANQPTGAVGERPQRARTLSTRYNTTQDLAIDVHSRILHIAKTVGGMPRIEETECNGGNTSIADVASSGSGGRNANARRFDRYRRRRGSGSRACPAPSFRGRSHPRGERGPRTPPLAARQLDVAVAPDAGCRAARTVSRFAGHKKHQLHWGFLFLTRTAPTWHRHRDGNRFDRAAAGIRKRPDEYRGARGSH